MEGPVTATNNPDVQRPSLKETFLSYLAMAAIVLCPCLLVMCFKIVQQYERAVKFRFGRVTADSPAGPGNIFFIPFMDTVILLDLRTRSFSLGQQEILTRDSVTVTVDAVIFFHIKNPKNCLLNVELHIRATELLAVSLLRNILGQYTLTELLANRDTISSAIRKEIDKGTVEWGIEVERVEIKDVILPFDLQKAMAAEAEGTRVAKAKIIEAEGEIRTAENLLEASKLLVESPNTIILRYLQTLNYIAAQQTTSILFPFPMEIPRPSASSRR